MRDEVMRDQRLIVLPAPESDWSRERLGKWIEEMGHGVEGLLMGAAPIAGREHDQDLLEALLWLANDLGALVVTAGRLLAGKKVELRRESVGTQTDRLGDMARIIAAQSELESDSIAFVRDQIAWRLKYELAEHLESRRAEARA